MAKKLIPKRKKNLNRKVLPQPNPEFLPKQEKIIINKKIKFLGSIQAYVLWALILVAVYLLLSRIENKNFNLQVSDAESIDFQVLLTEDSLKSPLCNCPNPDLNSYGFMQFFKNVTINDSNDTTSFVITAPSSQNLSTYGSYQFKAKLYVFKKTPFMTYDVDSVLQAGEYLQNFELLYKKDLDSIYYVALINNGTLKSKMISDNYISSLLPGNNAHISFKKKFEKYSDTLKSISVDYKAKYINTEEAQQVFYEYFGPKVSFYSDSTFEVLGAKGGEIMSDKKELKALAENTFCLLVVDVPYKARISMGIWGDFQYNAWHSEMLKERFKGEVKTGLFINHTPHFLEKSDGSHVLYDFHKDKEAVYLPPIFIQSAHNINFSLENPLNEKEYSDLLKKTNANGKIYSNPSFSNGITIESVTPLELQIPDSILKLEHSLFSDTLKYFGFEKARRIAEKYLYIAKKYGTIPLPPIKNDITNIELYYPQLPTKNGIYYFGNLGQINFSKAKYTYSYGISGKEECNACDLSLSDININNASPFYAPIPLNLSKHANTELAFEIHGKASMEVNDEQIGKSFFQNRFFQDLAGFMGILGVSVIGIWQYIKRNPSLSK